MKVNQRQADAICSTLLRAFQREDRKGFFTNPVCFFTYPDYCCFIKNPMDLQTISRRFDTGFYNGNDASAMIRDLFMILDNATLYNPPSHDVYQEAERIRIVLSSCLHDTINRILEKTQGSSLLKETRHPSVIDVALILSEGFFHRRS